MPTPPAILPAYRLRHRGMNFAEVLFAVMILGIGFIMVAAIFPVAIQQSKSNTDETVAARLADSTIQILRQHSASLTGSTGVTAITPADPVGKNLHRSFIYENDPRYGQIILYRSLTAGSNQMAQVYVVSMQVNNRPQYTADDLINSSAGAIINPSTFQPRSVRVMTQESGSLGSPDLVQFLVDNSGTWQPEEPEQAIDGAVVIISQDMLVGPDDDATTDIKEVPDLHTGKWYRLGQKRADVGVGVWELMPGQDLHYFEGDPVDEKDDIHENMPARKVMTAPVIGTDLPNASRPPAAGFLIGRGHDNPNAPGPVNANWTGGNQAITVFTALIPVRP